MPPVLKQELKGLCLHSSGQASSPSMQAPCSELVPFPEGGAAMVLPVPFLPLRTEAHSTQLLVHRVSLPPLHLPEPTICPSFLQESYERSPPFRSQPLSPFGLPTISRLSPLSGSPCEPQTPPPAHKITDSPTDTPPAVTHCPSHKLAFLLLFKCSCYIRSFMSTAEKNTVTDFF